LAEIIKFNNPGNAMSLKSGTAVVDITPENSMFLVGYPHVERMSEGVNDPLCASALYLENKHDSLLMIAVDILFIDAKTVNEIRRGIADRCNVRTENIMISCTHTHSGPVTIDMLSFSHDPVVPEVNHEYMIKFTRRIIEAGVQAASITEPAETAVTSANISGVGGNRHNPDGLRDPEAGIIVISNPETKKIKAISLIYSMHPTILHEDSKLVSADFPGYTREYLKSRFGADIVILYHTGPEGNLSPRYDVKGQTFEEAERLGNILGGYVADKIDVLSDEDFDAEPRLGAASSMITPVRRAMPSRQEAEQNLIFRRGEFARLKNLKVGHGPIRTAECAVFGAEETSFLAKCVEDGSLDRVLADYVQVELQVLRIGAAYIVAFPGEMFVEFALKLKQESPVKTFAVCLANGEMQGYIATEDATGYEADNSLFAPGTGYLMVDAALKLISGFKQI
jgi:Neutral/alkaline non-lysosomal ceramidase, N-terminal